MTVSDKSKWGEVIEIVKFIDLKRLLLMIFFKSLKFPACMLRKRFITTQSYLYFSSSFEFDRYVMSACGIFLFSFQPTNWNRHEWKHLSWKESRIDFYLRTIHHSIVKEMCRNIMKNRDNRRKCYKLNRILMNILIFQ